MREVDRPCECYEDDDDDGDEDDNGNEGEDDKKGINVIDFVPVNCACACDAKGSDLSVKYRYLWTIKLEE